MSDIHAARCMHRSNRIVKRCKYNRLEKDNSDQHNPDVNRILYVLLSGSLLRLSGDGISTLPLLTRKTPLPVRSAKHKQQISGPCTQRNRLGVIFMNHIIIQKLEEDSPCIRKPDTSRKHCTIINRVRHPVMYTSPNHAKQEKQYSAHDHHLHISRMQDNTAHTPGSNAERKQSGSTGHPRALIREETGNPVV